MKHRHGLLTAHYTPGKSTSAPGEASKATCTDSAHGERHSKAVDEDKQHGEQQAEETKPGHLPTAQPGGDENDTCINTVEQPLDTKAIAETTKLVTEVNAPSQHDRAIESIETAEDRKVREKEEAKERRCLENEELKRRKAEKKALLAAKAAKPLLQKGKIRTIPESPPGTKEYTYITAADVRAQRQAEEDADTAKREADHMARQAAKTQHHKVEEEVKEKDIAAEVAFKLSSEDQMAKFDGEREHGSEFGIRREDHHEEVNMMKQVKQGNVQLNRTQSSAKSKANPNLDPNP